VAESLGHVLLAGATLLAWLGAGSLVLAPLGAPGDRLLDGLNRIGAGALAFALATFAAGWAGALSSAAYRLVFAVAAAGGAWVAFRLLRGARLRRIWTWRPWELALGGLLIAYAVLGAVATSAPISSPDALLYHAADPARFVEAGRIFEVPGNSSSYEPFTVQMLVLDGLLLQDSVQGAFAPFLLALVAAAAVAGAAERLAGRTVALLATAVFFAQPLMLWEATSTFIESGLAFAVALAGWNLLRFARQGDREALVVAGLFAGGAAGMKYLGLIAVLALAVAAGTALRRRLTVARVLAFTAPAVLVALPWYVKNTVLTGNPVYPHLFGGLNASAAAELDATMASFGHGRSVADFLLLPVRLVADGEAFDGGEFLSPLFVAFAPLALLVPGRRLVRVAAAAGIAVYVVAWFATTQQARFLVPMLPALAVLAALGALALAGKGPLGRVVAVGGTAAALLVGLGISLVYAAQFAPVAVGHESEEHFLSRKVSLYDGVDWLNDRLGEDDKVLVSLWSLLYLDVPYVTFGTMGDLLPLDAGPEATRTFVAENRVTHVAVLADDEARRRQVGYLDARLLKRVPVTPVRSRTRDERGPTKEMLVYELERRP
jgi:Dolichyl-phosphate-mannose-protein mannosyltransferase